MTDAQLVHEVHTSERKSFRGCRRRWGWVFRENYYPRITAKPLEFGVAYHAALEVAYDPERWQYPRDVRRDLAIKTFRAKCQSQWDKFLTTPEAELADYDEVRTDYNERMDLGEGMLRYFFDVVAPDFEKKIKRPVKTEVSFKAPVVDPKTGLQLRCNQLTCSQHEGQSVPVVFAGRIDLVLEDHNDDLWVLDWKTSARLSEDRDEFLDLDDQVGGYCAAMRALGVPIRGFIYFEQNKAVPAPPERLKTPRLGRAFSTNRQQATTYALAEKTFMEEDPDAFNDGLYDDYLQFLQNDGRKFHMVFQKYRSDKEIDEILNNLFLEARDMVNPALPLYPNPGRFACGSCAFRQPCLEKNGGGDYRYALDSLFDKREHYWVRTEPSTDTKGGE